MNPVTKFPYHLIYGGLRPVANVEILTNHTQLLLEMVVDSGADVTTISTGFAKKLGVDLNQRPTKSFKGLAGISLDCIMKKVTIKIAGVSFQAPVAIPVSRPEVPLILGRE